MSFLGKQLGSNRPANRKRKQRQTQIVSNNGNIAYGFNPHVAMSNGNDNADQKSDSEGDVCINIYYCISARYQKMRASSH